MQRAGHLVEVETHHPAHGDGRQGSGQMMASPHRQEELTALHAKRQTAASGLNVVGAEVAALRTRHPGNLRPAISDHVSQPGIVAEHRSAVGRQGGEQFGLALGDVLPAAETAQMGVADARNHADFRPAHFRQCGDFAGPARANSNTA